MRRHTQKQQESKLDFFFFFNTLPSILFCAEILGRRINLSLQPFWSLLNYLQNYI